MGNCFGRSVAQKREQNWKATGMVTLRDAGLKYIPGNVLAIAGSIRILDLSSNSISELSDADLQLFTALQRLVLSNNNLRHLPGSIGTLRQLKHLALDANKLSQLPPGLGQLSKLEQLLLQGNQLASLPASLGGLKVLKSLNLSGNQLTQLPEALGDCSSLQVGMAWLPAASHLACLLSEARNVPARVHAWQWCDGNRCLLAHSNLPRGTEQGAIANKTQNAAQQSITLHFAHCSLAN